MPQVFGSDQVDLISQTSLFSESAVLTGDPSENDHLAQFASQHGFFPERVGERNPAQIASAAGRIAYTRYLGAKTINDAPPKTKDGQLLNGNGWHELVVHVNNKVREGSTKPQAVGDNARYNMVHQHVDANGELHERPIGNGWNTVRAMNNDPHVRMLTSRLGPLPHVG